MLPAPRCAAAKALGVVWNMTGDGFDQGDVGTHIEVRHSTRPNAGLIVRGKDRPGRVFVLVTGKLPAYRLCGWKGVENARRPEYRWRDAWRVPQSALRPVEELVQRRAA
jgi:hypothetical protein